MSRPRYQRYDEGAVMWVGFGADARRLTCNVCHKNPPTRRWEQCCMGPGAGCAAYESPPDCSPESNRMKTCGECRAKRRRSKEAPRHER